MEAVLPGAHGLARTLNVYRLSTPDWLSGDEFLRRLFHLLRFDNPTLVAGTEPAVRIWVEGRRTLFLDSRTGWIDFRDADRLLVGAEPIDLSDDAVREICQPLQSLVRAYIEASSAILSLRCGAVLGTIRVRCSQTEGRRVTKIDKYISCQAFLGTLPVVGDIGKLGITVARDGNIAEFHLGWQEPVCAMPWEQRPPPAKMATSFDRLSDGVDDLLTYQVQESTNGGRHLVPMYQRLIALPAESEAVHGSAPRPATANISLPATEWMASVPVCKSATRRIDLFGDQALRAAATWIADEGALSGTCEAAGKFIGALPSNWKTSFNLGDTDVVADLWLDASAAAEGVDFVFYSGHAAAAGWMVAAESFVTWSKLSKKKLGRRAQAKWMALAACGPLCDKEVLHDGTNAVELWMSAFGGLRTMLAYSTVILAGQNEGESLVRAARLPHATLTTAWLTASRRCQPSSVHGPVWGAAMWPIATPNPESDNPFLLKDHRNRSTIAQVGTAEALFWPV